MEAFWVICPVLGAVAYWTQWPRPRVQGELQETGGGRCLEGVSCQKALFCREEHVHFCPLRNQNSEQEQPRLGTRTWSCYWLLWRRWWVIDSICPLRFVFVPLIHVIQNFMFICNSLQFCCFIKPYCKTKRANAAVVLLVPYCELFVLSHPPLSSVIFWHCLRENVSG